MEPLTVAEVQAKIDQYELWRSEYIRNLSSMSFGTLAKAEQDLNVLYGRLWRLVDDDADAKVETHP